MFEVAVFRQLQGGKPGYFITIASKLLPPTERFTITIVPLKEWEKGRVIYEHIEKKRGRATIKKSPKISINREVVEALNLQPHDVIWVRVLPYTENPPPPAPYIALARKIHCDRTSYFFTIARRQIEYLRRVSPGKNLHVTVYVGDKAIDYIKRPIPITKDDLYKVVLPSALFENMWHATVLVKIKTTDKDEELYYTKE